MLLPASSELNFVSLNASQSEVSADRDGYIAQIVSSPTMLCRKVAPPRAAATLNSGELSHAPDFAWGTYLTGLGEQWTDTTLPVGICSFRFGKLAGLSLRRYTHLTFSPANLLVPRGVPKHHCMLLNSSESANCTRVWVDGMQCRRTWQTRARGRVMIAAMGRRKVK